MKLHKVYVHSDNIASFLCPSCEQAKDFDITEYEDIDDTLHIEHTCKCGKQYKIRVERRRFFRKYVDLEGFYSWGDEKTKRPMLVRDLSRSGMKIEILDDMEIQAGDKLFVEFVLDNEQKMKIRREVIVRTVFGKKLGTEFASRDPNNPFDKVFDMAIGNYTFHR